MNSSSLRLLSRRTAPFRRTASRLALTAVAAILLVSVSGGISVAVHAQDLLVSAAKFTDTGAIVSIHPYDFASGYSDPLVAPGKAPTLPNSLFTANSDIVAGGFGCPAWISDAEAVRACLSGECSNPLMGRAIGGVFTRQLGADDRDILNVSGASDARLAVERYDTSTGERTTFFVQLTAASGVPASTVPDVHAIYRSGNDWDVMMRTFSNNVERGHVVRIDRDGGIVSEYALPFGVVPLAADRSGDQVLVQERFQAGGWGITRYSANYDRLGSLVPGGELSTRVALEIVGNRVMAYRPDNTVGVWNATNGNDIGSLPLPEDTDFITHFTAPYDCQNDDTTVRIGGNLRFELSGTVRDQQGMAFPIRFAPPSSSQAVEAYFFGQDNREMLIKTLDACGFTGTHWFFVAAATDLQFDLTVRNRETGQVETFSNPPGTPAASINEVFLFDCN